MKDRERDEQLRRDAQQFPELASMYEEMRSILEGFERHEEECERRDKANEEAEREADEARAERARAGELGPRWQEIQKRIDQGKTTVSDVFNGNDNSPEARSLRQESSKNLGRIHDQWVKEAEEDDRAENPLTQMSAARQEHEARVRTLDADLDSVPRWPDRS